MSSRAKATPRRGARAVLLSGLMTASLAPMSGCLDDATRNQMAEADSVLAPLFNQQPTPKEAAAWASDPYDADKRARGTLLLANAPFGGEEPYLELYRQHLEDKSSPVRATAVRALALHGSPEDVPRLIPLMTSEERMLRLEATRALQRLYNPVAVTPLVGRLDQDKELEPEIRAEAASALGQYADAKGLQALMGALADPSLLVNMNALESLRTLTGKTELPADRKAWVRWANATKTPFAGQKAYVYPIFWREKRWLDYLPFMPEVPNEVAASPAGFPDLGVKAAGGSAPAEESRAP